MYFNDPKVLLDFAAIPELAREEGFLNSPNAAFDEVITQTLAAVSIAGYDTNPTHVPTRTGGTVSALAGTLVGIARQQNPHQGHELGVATRNAELIATRANLAAQDASLPVTIRRIGGLAVTGLPKGLWSDKEIAELPPNEKGERVLTFDSTRHRDGHYSQITVRELNNQEIPAEGEWYADPALIVRTKLFGTVKAKYSRGMDIVSFESTSVRGLSVALQAGKITFLHSANANYNDRLRYHAESGQQLRAILSAADELMKARPGQVRPAIQAMIDIRSVKPIPVTAKLTKPPTKSWWRRGPYSL